MKFAESWAVPDSQANRRLRSTLVSMSDVMHPCRTCRRESKEVLTVDALRDSTEQLVFYQCDAGHLSVERQTRPGGAAVQTRPGEIKLFTLWAKRLVHFKRGRHGK
jgi:hypothetical protein